jgi:hypothetical protein
MSMTIQLIDSDTGAPLNVTPAFAFKSFGGGTELRVVAYLPQAQYRIDITDTGLRRSMMDRNYRPGPFRIVAGGYDDVWQPYQDGAFVQIRLRRTAIPQITPCSVADLRAARPLPSGDIISLTIEPLQTGVGNQTSRTTFGAIGISLRRGWPGRTGQHVRSWKQAQLWRGSTAGMTLRSEDERTPRQLGANEHATIIWRTPTPGPRPTFAQASWNWLLQDARIVFTKDIGCGARRHVCEVAFGGDLPMLGWPNGTLYTFSWEKD